MTVASHGSFTKAARELYVAQSTLSRQVAALERELGAPLFERTGSTVRTTPGGAAFLGEAERVLVALDRARSFIVPGRPERPRHGEHDGGGTGGSAQDRPLPVGALHQSRRRPASASSRAHSSVGGT